MQTIVVRAIVVDIKARTGHKNAGPKQSNLCCCDKKSRSSAPPEAKIVNREPKTNQPDPAQPQSLQSFRFESCATGAYILLLLSCLLHVYEQTHSPTLAHTHTRTHVLMVCELVVAAKWKRMLQHLAFPSLFCSSLAQLKFYCDSQEMRPKRHSERESYESELSCARAEGWWAESGGSKHSKGSHCVDSNHMLPALRCHMRAFYIYPALDALWGCLRMRDIKIKYKI